MFVTISTVRLKLTDLLSYWPTETGIIGPAHVDGHYIALMIKGAPQLVKAGFESETERDAALKKLDRLKKTKQF